MTITGKTLVQWGIPTGKSFKDMIARAQEMEIDGRAENDIYAEIMSMVPVEVALRTNSIPFGVFLDPEDDDERANLEAVIRHVDSIVRLPSVVSASVMPDAMPSGSQLGTIPVGGVVVTDGTIHPGMHSADICCSMAITIFKRDESVARVLDEAMKVTHFGWGTRSKSEVRQHRGLKDLISEFADNRFLRSDKAIDAAESHFMTQGDGNHFLYVGHLESTGQLALVTHHGSRGLGAMLYKYGMAAAQKNTKINAPRVPDHQTWLDYSSFEGEQYWEALQIIRRWTKMNHYAIHDAIATRLGNKVEDRFWNEHNFVFLKDDKFYHAKGATPSYSGFSEDDDGRTLIPMNMASPILIAGHSDNSKSNFFAPHGAGRNYSRTEHNRRLLTRYGTQDPNVAAARALEEETKDLDVRFYSGTSDPSELPSSYKSAGQVERQIRKHGLATITDRVLPGGSIMAGELPKPWLERRGK